MHTAIVDMGLTSTLMTPEHLQPEGFFPAPLGFWSGSPSSYKVPGRQPIPAYISSFACLWFIFFRAQSFGSLPPFCKLRNPRPVLSMSGSLLLAHL